MFYATMMMHKQESPPQKPDQFRKILILEKGATNFKMGLFHNNQYHDDIDGTVIMDVDMWCEIPTRDTIHKVNKL